MRRIEKSFMRQTCKMFQSTGGIALEKRRDVDTHSRRHGIAGGDATVEPISPNGTVSVAVTIDDLFMWKGTPIPSTHSPLRTATDMVGAFANHGIKGVYSFSGTAPAEENRELFKVFDRWTEAGHYVSNHTHNHASLNWINAKKYIADIERTEEFIHPWASQAPTKFFRYCMDMWGDTREKHEAVEEYLMRSGYLSSPLSAWFYDHAWIVPHWRACKLADKDAIGYLKRTFVETAVDQFRRQAAAARQMFGRDPAHIWLVHGSPIGGECIGEILDAFAAANVRFISLEEAMLDPIYKTQPVITHKFRNQTQKWAEARGVIMPQVPPDIVHDIDKVAHIDGETNEDIFGNVLKGLCDSVGGEFSWPGWD